MMGGSSFPAASGGNNRFGINTTIGGSSIFQMLQAATGGAISATVIPWLGISPPELACFGLFWAIQVGSEFPLDNLDVRWG
jgi:cytosine/uracil/thiamine/allantoin permease